MTLHHERPRVVNAGVPSTPEHQPASSEVRVTADLLLFLRSTPLLASLSDTDLRLVAVLVREVEVPAGSFVLHEGETGEEVFIVKDGELQVLKGDPSRALHEIARLGAGASVGELALLDAGPRSASVRATRQTTLYAFSPREIAGADGPPELLRQLSRAIANRLRFTNEVTVRLLQMQVASARFIAFIIFSLSIYAFALSMLTRYATQTASNTLVTVSLMLVLTATVLNMVRRLGFPVGFYGLTLAGWRRAVAESLAATVLVCALIVALKWIVLRAGLSPGHALFEPFAAINVAAPAQGSVRLWLAMAVLYAFHAPFQEFVVRGCLQGALQEFLRGTYRQSVAVVGSNLIFSAFHLYLSLGFAIVTFLPGLLWGWLYRRHGTLVGVALSHVLVGLWAVFVVGIEGVLL